MSGNQNNPLHTISNNPFIAQSLELNKRFGLFPSVTQDPSSLFNNSLNDVPSENSKSAGATEQSSKTTSTTGMAEAERAKKAALYER